MADKFKHRQACKHVHMYVRAYKHTYYGNDGKGEHE
jgi:hypothetical protein